MMKVLASMTHGLCTAFGAKTHDQYSPFGATLASLLTHCGPINEHLVEEGRPIESSAVLRDLRGPLTQEQGRSNLFDL